MRGVAATVPLSSSESPEESATSRILCASRALPQATRGGGSVAWLSTSWSVAKGLDAVVLSSVDCCKGVAGGLGNKGRLRDGFTTALGRDAGTTTLCRCLEGLLGLRPQSVTLASGLASSSDCPTSKTRPFQGATSTAFGRFSCGMAPGFAGATPVDRGGINARDVNFVARTYLKARAPSTLPGVPQSTSGRPRMGAPTSASSILASLATVSLLPRLLLTLPVGMGIPSIWVWLAPRAPSTKPMPSPEKLPVCTTI
mmetsp:Transcript_73789/g.158291  ORF Transcript_73789/g.158291 Transcript_73789/m.158291 type:complete len:256 (+) Transcript_73789:145-912(+)